MNVFSDRLEKTLSEILILRSRIASNVGINVYSYVNKSVGSFCVAADDREILFEILVETNGEKRNFVQNDVMMRFVKRYNSMVRVETVLLSRLEQSHSDFFAGKIVTLLRPFDLLFEDKISADEADAFFQYDSDRISFLQSYSDNVTPISIPESRKRRFSSIDLSLPPAMPSFRVPDTSFLLEISMKSSTSSSKRNSDVNFPDLTWLFCHFEKVTTKLTSVKIEHVATIRDLFSKRLNNDIFFFCASSADEVPKILREPMQILNSREETALFNKFLRSFSSAEVDQIRSMTI